MISITSSRIKKALLHPKEAFAYFKNYLKGEIIRINSKKQLSPNFIKSLRFEIWPMDDLIESALKSTFLIKTAERILNNEFGFLGLSPKILKDIDWHQDIKSGHIWSNDFYLDLREKLIKDYNKGWDIKYVWELSRFHYLIPLALAYFKTGEEKYFNKWQELIDDWIKNNPVYYGPNWINTMEVAIRACNWILSFEIIEKKIQETRYKIQDTFLERFLGSLYEHGRFIFNNLEYAPIRSNHYLTDILGLIYLGNFLKNNKESQKWLFFGKRALEKEIQYQVYEDGVDYELSTSYHCYKTELFLWAAYLLKINKINLSNNFWLKLGKMMNFALAIIKPNGLIPQLGDNDNSRLHLIWEDYYSWEKRDLNSLIKLFSLVTKQQVDNYPLQSFSFPKGGIYVLRDNNFYLITGRHHACYGKGGSHIHNDILSFELSLFGKDLIIDPGTYVYTPDYKERNKFRSTQAHNIALVDNQEQNPLFQDPFYFEQRAQMFVRHWEEQKDFIIFEAEHNGYRYLKQPLIYRRKFFWDKNNKVLSITDTFKYKGKHTLEWNFHLAPEIQLWCKTQVKNYREIILIASNYSFLLQAPEELNCAIIEDEVSPSYGVKGLAKTIRFSGFLDKNTPQNFEFIIKPIRHG